MRSRWRSAVVVGLLSCCLSGCGTTSDLDIVRPAAAEMLELWERALAAAPPGALVPVVGVNDLRSTVGDPGTYETPSGLAGGIITFHPGTDRSAPERAGDLPVVAPEAAARAAWQSPDSERSKGASVLRNPRWEQRQMLTTVGPVDVPVWRFDVERSHITVTAVAIDARYLITPRGTPDDSPARRAQRTGDRTVDFAFAGAPENCHKEYRAHAVEGVHSFTVAVETLTSSAFGSCGMSAEYRMLTVELQSPIGERVFVAPDGQPVFIAGSANQ